MAQLIKNGAEQRADDWQFFTPAEGEAPETLTLPAVPASGGVVFPLAVWLARKAEIIASYPRIGLLMAGHEPVEAIADEVSRFALIAIHFPKFVDGRGYSAASLLRRRHGYTGELRAVGEVLHDQLFFMRRVGFDAFALKDDKSVAYALAHGFTTFSNRYQASTDEALPLFRRRTA